MFYKNNLLILLIISMFTFFEKADAKYEKLFFDHSIKNISNEKDIKLTFPGSIFFFNIFIIFIWVISV